jgi:hypothetical protein
VGTIRDVSNLRNAFLRVLDKAELRHHRVQDLRHTFASLLGIGPPFVRSLDQNSPPLSHSLSTVALRAKS